MEETSKKRIHKMKDLLYQWKDKGKYMHIYLKCQNLELKEGDMYCVRMSSINHTVDAGVPDSVRSQLYNLQQTEWAEESTHAFTTPLKTFYFCEAFQKLQFSIFVLSADESEVRYCSAEEKFYILGQQNPTPLDLMSEDGKKLGELSCSMIELDESDDEENKVSLHMTIQLSRIGIQFINNSKLKIYGQGNHRSEYIEIYSSDKVPRYSHDSEELSLTFQLKDIIISSIYGNKKKPYCWFYIFLEGQNEQSEKKTMYLLFPVYREALLSPKQEGPIKILQKYKENIPAFLDLEELNKLCSSIPSAIYSISDLEIQEKFKFLEFLFAGLHLNLVIGIDYSQSNCKNNKGHSFHSLAAIDQNPYVKVLDVVGGQTLLPLCKIPVASMYGIACKSKNSHNKTNYRLELTVPEQLSGVNSEKSMLVTYLESIEENKVIFSGMSKLKPLIELTREKARKEKEDKKFFILLIITDGFISDMLDTIDEIKNNCVKVPMSIVIVGVGDGEDQIFKDLEGLCNHKEFERDMVTFVQINHYHEQYVESFQAKILDKLSAQITQYYQKTRKMNPNDMKNIIEVSQDEIQPNKISTNTTIGNKIKGYLQRIEKYLTEKENRIFTNQSKSSKGMK